MPLQEKMEILFDFHREYGLKPTDYSAIGKGTGISIANVQRLYRSRDVNPRATTLRAILAYFDTPWAYLDCQTPNECRAYLATLQEGSSAATLAEGLRSLGLSGQPANIVTSLILLLRQMEKGSGRATLRAQKASEGAD